MILGHAGTVAQRGFACITGLGVDAREIDHIAIPQRGSGLFWILSIYPLASRLEKAHYFW
jgi:hypothetical protein